MQKGLFFIFLVLSLGLGFQICTQTANSAEKNDLGKFFTDVKVGTFVLYDESKDTYLVYNDRQSRKRLSPCSIFKIPHSIIGLESGMLDQDDAKTLMKWDGTKYFFPAANRDQTLSSATRDSVVWYFQALATKIGAERMQAYLQKMNYGNQDISGGLTTFWLTSSLKISAREEVRFLQALYSGKLPIMSQNIEIVQKNITLEQNAERQLMGKTGSGLENGKGTLGWFVGCVEKKGKRYFFATNVEADDGVSGRKAKEITQAILKELGI